MPISILYEDDYLLVIEKLAGMVVNKAESVRGATIQDWAEKKLKIQNSNCKVEDEKDFYGRAGIVHRLDKETSGLLIIAKTPQVFSHLQSQFKERQIVKKYCALVHGKVTPITGEIKATVGRLPWNRERFGILPGGRWAVTSFRVISIYKLNANFYSLLEVKPLTGRTHQIRIHLKYLGHSVVSDSFYAGRKIYRQDLHFCPRLFLHASFIEFRHPVTGDDIKLESKLPLDLREVLDKIEELKN